MQDCVRYPACRGSPTSQKIVFKHVKAARNMSLAKVLQTDFRLLHHMCHISHDFVEGIRAKLIEKDNNARWKPATVHEVGIPCSSLLPSCHSQVCPAFPQLNRKYDNYSLKIDGYFDGTT